MSSKMNKFTQRIFISFILVIALFFTLFARKKTSQYKVVAVVQMAKLGDMVCTTPLFRALREKYPHAKIIVFGNTINREVLEGNLHISEYVSLDKSFLRTLSALRTRDIEGLCVTGPSFYILSAAIITRIPLIVVPRIVSGWSPYVTTPYRILSRSVTTKEHHMGSYAPREYLRLLEPFDIYTNDTRKEVYFSDTALTKIRTVYSDTTSASPHSIRIGILPGAGNEIKSWQPEKFASLMNMIDEHTNVKFLLLGSEKDTERAQYIQYNLKENVSVTNCIGKLSLDELKACISTLDVVIGADTGPQYIAEALDIPTIDIVGPVDEREQPPMGEKHRIVKAEREKAELYVMNARVYNEKEAQRQVDAITAEMVFTEFKKLFVLLKR